MAYFKICPECGAHLDPDEVCDCQKEQWRMEVELLNGNRFCSHIHGNPFTVFNYYKDEIKSVSLERIA